MRCKNDSSSYLPRVGTPPACHDRRLQMKDIKKDQNQEHTQFCSDVEMKLARYNQIQNQNNDNLLTMIFPCW